MIACAACEAGKFKSAGTEGTWQDTCSPCAECDVIAQWYEPSQETCDKAENKIDRACNNHADSACNDDQYEQVEPTPTSARVCISTTACVIGVQYETTALTATSDRNCVNYEAAECEAPDTYENVSRTATNDRVCVATSLCMADHYVSAMPTATSAQTQ